MRLQAQPRVTILFVLLAIEACHAAPAILRLADVQPGMRGIGKTVFRGTEIEEFPFEVVEVLETDGYSPSLILVRLSGETIDAVGGIAAGMSGSPLYVDGKLLGAVAFTTPNSDTRVGYATPIEDMLKLFALDTAPAAPAEGLPAGTPILAAGLRGRALEAATRLMARRGWRLLPTGRRAQAAAAGAEPAPGADLAEGGAVAVSLTNGSVAMTAIGTVTWRDGDRLLAFGHPFLRRGPTSLFLQSAYIYDTVWSADLPFKIGAPLGEPVGTVVQDREAGLAALLGPAPESFQIVVNATDATLGRARTLTVDVVQDGDLAPSLAAVVLMQAMEEVMDRDGGGTATVGWRIEAEGLSEPLHRTDVHYSPDDVVAEAVSGPLFTVDTLLRNDFAPVTPRRIVVDVTTTDERRTARLVDVAVEPRILTAGQPCRLTVTLQPYRRPAFQRELTLTVPADCPAGGMVLDLHGRLTAPGPLSQAALMAAGVTPPRDLSELSAVIAGEQRGNALTVELLTPAAAAARQEARDLLGGLPSVDAFLGDEPASLPTMALDLGLVPHRAEAVAETQLEQVLQGRLQRTVQVAAP